MDQTFREYTERLRAIAGNTRRTPRTVDGVPLDPARLAACPVISVVTVAYNSARTIERTIASVLDQTYPHVEYVIVDGGSTDGTADVVRAFDSKLSYWHSHKDRGISDAFNLGIVASSGRYVAFVNADDWMAEDQCSLAVAALEKSGAAFAYGRLAFHAVSGAVMYTIDGDADYPRGTWYGMPHINHPTVVVRRAAYETVGPFDVERRIAMDFDWHLRAEKRGLRGVYVPELLGHMRDGGVCAVNWTRGLEEVRDISIAQGQSRLLSRCWYAVRLTRGKLRLALHRLAPSSWVRSLHRLVNPRYRPADGD